MKLLRNLIATLAIAIMPIVMSTGAGAQTFNNGGSGCSVRELGPFTNAFTVNGNVASTTVQVSGPARCHETVSVASWNAAIGSSGFVNQRFHTGRTFTLPTGRHTLSVNIDNSCTYQADLLLGSRLTSASGDARYGPAFLMGYKQARVGVCGSTPAPAPAPAAPTTVNVCSGDTTNMNSGIGAQGGNCSTNTVVATGNTVEGNTNVGNPTVTNNTPAPTPAPAPAAPATVTTASAAQPTQLANTGPGDVVALFAVATIGGALFHRLVLRKSLQRF